jgi:hypothetical protein
MAAEDCYLTARQSGVMPMANIRTLFDTILAVEFGKKVTVQGVASATQYETIRTRLVKFWTEHREILIAISDDDPAIRLSLCGNYQRETNSATFYLGPARRKAALEFSFTIEGEDEPDATSGSPPAQAGTIAEVDSSPLLTISCDDNSTPDTTSES